MTAHLRTLRSGLLRVERLGRHVKVAWGGLASQGPVYFARLDCHSAPTADMLERWLLTEPDSLDPHPEAFVRRMTSTLEAVIWRGRRRCGRA